MIRFLRWLFRSKLDRSIARARAYGKITFEQFYGFQQTLIWRASIRPEQKGDGWRSEPSYAWTGDGQTLAEALSEALEEAEGFPMKRLDGAPCMPKLGGAQFDGD